MNPVASLPPGPLFDHADQRWQQLCQAAQAQGVTLDNQATTGDRGWQVLGLSEFVVKHLLRHPQWAAELLDPAGRAFKFEKSRLRESLSQALADVADEAGLMQVLRRFRNHMMVRIAWADLQGQCQLPQVFAALSNLADVCLEKALSLLQGWQTAQLGQPLGAGGEPQFLVVLALGKLGARELNFSSDIDLIYAFPAAGQTDHATRPISNEEYFTRLGRQLTKVLNQTDAEGFVFRVDLRLRPYGENGPLVMSFDAMEDYFQRQGRDWERYAWIKARVAAGDAIAGQRLLDQMHPFVYRRYLDYGAYEALRNMKRMIAEESVRKDIGHNLKLGPGGIREVEFFGQIFQLIRGGVDGALTQRPILTILAVLEGQGYIPADTHRELAQAYVFLRNSENRLQMIHDQQTHQLPGSEEDRLRLALAMGFEAYDAFLAALARHTQRVQLHFAQLLSDPSTSETAPSRLESLDTVWQLPDSESEAQDILLEIGYQDPTVVLALLRDLKERPGAQSLSETGRKRLDQLMPILLVAAGNSLNPEKCLDRILKLIGAILRRTTYLALLYENRSALEHLVRLAEASTWIVSYLSRHPVLLDELLAPHLLKELASRAQLKEEVARRLTPDSSDLEMQIEQLCIAKQVQILRIAAADISGEFALMKVSDRLSDTAETVLEQVMSLAWQQLTQRHGVPPCHSDSANPQSGFAVIAFGKLGGYELGYASDLDLVFLHDADQIPTVGSDQPIDSPQFFARLGQRMVHILTARTRAGSLYEVDMRLRPSGSSGPLVSHIRSYRAYHLEEAWTWEHQALVRARAVCGNPQIMNQFVQTRQAALAQSRDPGTLKKEVLDMRARLQQANPALTADRFDIKHSPGGMVDIEFLIQYLVLAHAHKAPDITCWTDNVRILGSFVTAGIMDPLTAHRLKIAYLALRSLAHRCGLQERPAGVDLEQAAPYRELVQKEYNRVLGSVSP